MITIDVDTSGLRFLACQLLKSLGYDNLSPVVKSDLSLGDKYIQFAIGVFKVTAIISATAGGVKLTLQQISAAGIPAGSVARPYIRKAIIAKLTLAEKFLLVFETADANILITLKNYSVRNADIVSGHILLGII